MKETIYTIPINDAFANDKCECAVCEFMRKEEVNRIDYTLGASMMEPDARIETNKKGFCRRHMKMLFEHGNRLSLDLILETHIKEMTDLLESAEKKLNGKKPFFKNSGNKNTSDSFKYFETAVKSCTVCDKLNDIAEKFMSNLFYMYKNDVSFKDKFLNCRGFCAEHFVLLVNSANKYLSGNDCSVFFKEICKMQIKELNRLYADVDLFAKKHDYRYKDADWQNSRDAVERACLKMSSYIDS